MCVDAALTSTSTAPSPPLRGRHRREFHRTQRCDRAEIGRTGTRGGTESGSYPLSRDRAVGLGEEDTVVSPPLAHALSLSAMSTATSAHAHRRLRGIESGDTDRVRQENAGEDPTQQSRACDTRLALSLAQLPPAICSRSGRGRPPRVVEMSIKSSRALPRLSGSLDTHAPSDGSRRGRRRHRRSRSSTPPMRSRRAYR